MAVISHSALARVGATQLLDVLAGIEETGQLAIDTAERLIALLEGMGGSPNDESGGDTNLECTVL